MKPELKIALLFLTRQEINQSKLWQGLIEEASNEFNVYIHSKKPMKNSFFQSFRITKIVPTSHLIHVKAWQVLLEEALKDPSNHKFVFLSESCIPIYPLKDIHRHLIQDDYSTMCFKRPWWQEHEPREIQEFPPEHRWGNVEWIILNRKHAELIVNDHSIIDIVAKHNHDQESYPSTLFSFQGLLKEIIFRKTTYVNFKKGDHPEKQGDHPYLFEEDSVLNDMLMREAKRGGYIFARKFAPSFPEDTLHELLHLRLHPLPDEETCCKLTGMKLAEVAPILEGLKAWETQEEMSLGNYTYSLIQLINEWDLKKGCELGVFCGVHMERVLQETAIEELYGIDPYTIDFLTKKENECLYLILKNRLTQLAKGRAELVQLNPLIALEQVPDDALDYLFIRGEYFKESLSVLLEHGYSKVRLGGFFCGFGPFSLPTSSPPLQVESFFANKNLQVLTQPLEPGFWWVQKMTD